LAAAVPSILMRGVRGASTSERNANLPVPTIFRYR
jgi:hypothetical protein